jgi:hypothetical protein
MRSRIILLVLCGLMLPLAAQAQERYLLLATLRTGTMQKEMNEAAAKGYRLVAASRTESAEVLVVLERAQGAYEYHLIATRRTGTLQKEVTDAAERGFRVVPRAVTTKRQLGSTSQNDEGELLIVMEKGPDTPPGLSYKVLATSRTGTMQKEMSETAAAGYELIAVASRGEHIAIFERRK